MTGSRSRSRTRRIAGLATSLLALALLVPAGSALAQDASPAPEEASYLFVLSAPSGVADGETLTLHDVPAVTWFTDRPDRQAGQISPAMLDGFWPELVAAFDGVAPNAVLSVLGQDAVTNTVIELTGVDAVSLDETGSVADVVLRYTVVGGELPTGEIGTASLFIDNVMPTAGVKACLMGPWVVAYHQ